MIQTNPFQGPTSDCCQCLDLFSVLLVVVVARLLLVGSAIRRNIQYLFLSVFLSWLFPWDLQSDCRFRIFFFFMVVAFIHLP